MTELPDLKKEDLERLLEFFHADKVWLNHLIDRDYNCGCKFHSVNSRELCEEYTLAERVRTQQERLDLAQRDLDAYFIREEMEDNAI